MFSIQDALPELVNIAREAGELIMTHYQNNEEIYRKLDASPVTEADRAADRFIVEKIKTISEEYPIVSEEGNKPDVSRASVFWLIDPLDGTKSFIRGSGYFTVNIGLIENNVPILGIIYDPVSKTMYWGTEKGAFREHNGVINPIHVRKKHTSQTAFVSHTHTNKATEEYLTKNEITERTPCASSIKFCFLAEGKADIYPRFGPTMEWDTAAGHAILGAAGGSVTKPDGSPFLYGKENFLNGNFLAKGY